MAYVINDGDKPTSRFQNFTDLCCLAYNHLRRHSHLFISLLSLVCGMSEGRGVSKMEGGGGGGRVKQGKGGKEE